MTAQARPALLLAALAVLLVAPALVLGVAETDSARFNYVWARQFAELVQAGQLYPRWLPGSWNGLGSPAFVFYPPFAFHVDAVVHLLTFGALDVPHRLAVSTAVLLFVSGLTMRAWLLPHAGRGPALLAACAYMAAPYHLIDHIYRGAYAEFSVFAVLPLTMMGLRAAARSPRGIAGLAASYAALTMAHLPTALLASMTLLPGYAVFLATRSGTWRLALARCAAGAALGLALAAIYLLPAATLQDAIKAEVLWRPYFTPERWLLLNYAHWPQPVFMAAITSVALGLAFLAGTALLAGREAAFWAAAALGCLMLLAGVVPGFWTAVPLVAKVQFPWRILALAEFAAITACALAAARLSRRVLAGGLALAAVAWLPAFVFLGWTTVNQLAETRPYWAEIEGSVAQFLPDAAEYLPAHYPDRPTMVGMRPQLWDLPGPGTVICQPVATVCRGERAGLEGVRVRVEAEQATTVTVARFYWPGWTVAEGPGSALRPAGPYRFVAFDVPPGPSDVRLAIAATTPERWGTGISAAALGLLVLLLRVFRATPRLPRLGSDA